MDPENLRQMAECCDVDPWPIPIFSSENVMKRADLNDRGQAEYDRIVNEMMEEIEQIPSLPGAGHVLSCSHASHYRKVEKKYLPKLNEILNNSLYHNRK